MTDLTNYYQAGADEVFHIASMRIKNIDEYLTPLAQECLELEKLGRSLQMFQARQGWRWQWTRGWFITPEKLMDWCLANPGHDLAMFSNYECGYVINAIDELRQMLSNIQMNCENRGDAIVHLKEETHSWIFCDDPWDNIKESLNPWVEDLEGEFYLEPQNLPPMRVGDDT